MSLRGGMYIRTAPSGGFLDGDVFIRDVAPTQVFEDGVSVDTNLTPPSYEVGDELWVMAWGSGNNWSEAGGDAEWTRVINYENFGAGGKKQVWKRKADGTSDDEFGLPLETDTELVICSFFAIGSKLPSSFPSVNFQNGSDGQVNQEPEFQVADPALDLITADTTWDPRAFLLVFGWRETRIGSDSSPTIGTNRVTSAETLMTDARYSFRGGLSSDSWYSFIDFSYANPSVLHEYYVKNHTPLESAAAAISGGATQYVTAERYKLS